MPEFCSRSAKASTTGVLPLPPSTRLPTQRTGTPQDRGRPRRWRRLAPHAQKAARGARARIATLSGRAQNSGARMRHLGRRNHRSEQFGHLRGDAPRPGRHLFRGGGHALGRRRLFKKVR